jgi:hypothetical protein
MLQLYSLYYLLITAHYLFVYLLYSIPFTFFPFIYVPLHLFIYTHVTCSTFLLVNYFLALVVWSCSLRSSTHFVYYNIYLLYGHYVPYLLLTLHMLTTFVYFTHFVSYSIMFTTFTYVHSFTVVYSSLYTFQSSIHYQKIKIERGLLIHLLTMLIMLCLPCIYYVYTYSFLFFINIYTTLLYTFILYLIIYLSYII